jgi:hypothetical protein
MKFIKKSRTMKSKKHIMSYKNFKKYRNRYMNMKIKGWLDDFLPNTAKPDPPINPDGTVPGR